MSTLEFLLERFGPLMKLDQVAQILGRSTEGLRQTTFGKSELASKLGGAAIRIGRNVRYRTEDISALIASGASSQPVNTDCAEEAARTGRT